VVYILCLILSIFVAIISNATYNYHVAIVSFLAARIILISSFTNNIMYTSNSAREAVAAGFILLSIVNIR
jgi:SHO1 osmosensor